MVQMKKRIQNAYRKFKPHLHWLIQNEGISLILSSLIIILAFYLFVKTDQEELNPFDYSVFITVIIAVFLNFFSAFVGKLLARYFEDDLKLTVDYEGLAKKYKYDELFIHNSVKSGVSKDNMKLLRKIKKAKDQKEVSIKLPIIVESYLYGKK